MPYSEVSSRVPNMLLSDRQCVLRGNQSSTNHLTYTMWLSLTLTTMSSPVCEASFTAWPTNSRCFFPWNLATTVKNVNNTFLDFTQEQPGFVLRIVDQLWVPSPESWNASTASTSPPFNCWKGFQDCPTNEIAKTKYGSELRDQCGKSYSLWCSKIPYMFPRKRSDWTDALFKILQGAGAGGQSTGPQSGK